MDVAHILDSLAPLPVRARTMFGEYGLYCDETCVALICNDPLYVKPTSISGEFLSDEAPPHACPLAPTRVVTPCLRA